MVASYSGKVAGTPGGITLSKTNAQQFRAIKRSMTILHVRFAETSDCPGRERIL